MCPFGTSLFLSQYLSPIPFYHLRDLIHIHLSHAYTCLIELSLGRHLWLLFQIPSFVPQPVTLHHPGTNKLHIGLWAQTKLRIKSHSQTFRQTKFQPPTTLPSPHYFPTPSLLSFTGGESELSLSLSPGIFRISPSVTKFHRKSPFFTRLSIVPGGQAPLDPPLTHSTPTHHSPLTLLTYTHEHTNTLFFLYPFLNFFFYRPILLPLRQLSGIKQNATYRRAGQLIKELRCPPRHSHALFVHHSTPLRFAHTFHFF